MEDLASLFSVFAFQMGLVVLLGASTFVLSLPHAVDVYPADTAFTKFAIALGSVVVDP